MHFKQGSWGTRTNKARGVWGKWAPGQMEPERGRSQPSHFGRAEYIFLRGLKN